MKTITNIDRQLFVEMTLRLLTGRLFAGPRPGASQCCESSQRGFMGWFVTIWNKVDQARIDEVGPDRACAEWLLRCGAAVKWKGGGNLLKDYNALPRGNFRKLKIQEVHAVEACVMEAGFYHLKDLTELKKINMSDCV